MNTIYIAGDFSLRTRKQYAEYLFWGEIYLMLVIFIVYLPASYFFCALFTSF